MGLYELLVVLNSHTGRWGDIVYLFRDNGTHFPDSVTLIYTL